jgi:hypothetical protein
MPAQQTVANSCRVRPAPGTGGTPLIQGSQRAIFEADKVLQGDFWPFFFKKTHFLRISN